MCRGETRFGLPPNRGRCAESAGCPITTARRSRKFTRAGRRPILREMSTATVANPYLREAVLTASPEQLQLMLYDGAIRFTMQGREALLKKDFEAVYNALTRAQKIVLEMHAGLRPEVNPTLCERVGALYMFVYHKLVDGSAHHDVQALDDALKILRLERETWQLLCDRVATDRGGDLVASDSEPEPGTLSVEV